MTKLSTLFEIEFNIAQMSLSTSSKLQKKIQNRFRLVLFITWNWVCLNFEKSVKICCIRCYKYKFKHILKIAVCKLSKKYL